MSQVAIQKRSRRSRRSKKTRMNLPPFHPLKWATTGTVHCGLRENGTLILKKHPQQLII